jgi:hypothetical protein
MMDISKLTDDSIVPDTVNEGQQQRDYQPSIRMVVQRYRKASILIDEQTVVTLGELPTLSTTTTMMTTSHSVESMLLNPVSGEITTSDSSAVETDKTDRATSNSPCTCTDSVRNNISNTLGMLVYISFSKTATPALVKEASKILLHLPVQTTGAWGDGSSTKSMFQLLRTFHFSKLQQQVQNGKVKPSHTTTSANSTSNSHPQHGQGDDQSPISILLVPQANLIAKIKKNGKSIQYHDQIDKSVGQELYDLFCKSVESLLLEHQTTLQRESSSSSSKPGCTMASNNNNNNNRTTTPDPSIPPTKLFQSPGGVLGNDNNILYGTFDGTTGLPLTMSDGQPLTKSAHKNVQKIYHAHVKRHEKWKQGQYQENSTAPTKPSSASSSNNTAATGKKIPSRCLDPFFVRLVCGSFGKRQGLELVSDMGPFCHVIEV